MTNPFQSPQTPEPPSPLPYDPNQNQGDSTGGVIPYKNPYALTAYYLGIFMLLCCVVPVPLGLAPLVLGIMGLRARARNPVIKGSVHAWIGVVLGALSTLGSILMLIGLIISIVAAPHRR